MKRILVIVVLLSAAVHAQVSYERLLRPGAEPHNWLTYSGTYAGHRYSTLTQITPENVRDLELTPRRRLDCTRDPHDIRIVEVQAGHRIT